MESCKTSSGRIKALAVSFSVLDLLKPELTPCDAPCELLLADFPELNVVWEL